jgi:hypothetical protein
MSHASIVSMPISVVSPPPIELAPTALNGGFGDRVAEKTFGEAAGEEGG